MLLIDGDLTVGERRLAVRAPWPMALALMTACHGPATVDPHVTHGAPLVGTEVIRPVGAESFSFAPDGRWVLFAVRGGTTARPRYALYEVGAARRQDVTLSDQARQITGRGRGFLPRAGCWDADSRRVVIPGDRVLFTLDPLTSPPEWQVVDHPSTPGYRKYYDCEDRRSAASIRVERSGPRAVRLVSASRPGQILARHDAADPTILGLDIPHVTGSPDGHWIAYVVTIDRLGFAAPPQGFLVERTAPTRPPTMLAAPVFGPFRWSPDGRYLYACARDRHRTVAIFRWEASHAG